MFRGERQIRSCCVARGAALAKSLSQTRGEKGPDRHSGDGGDSERGPRVLCDITLGTVGGILRGGGCGVGRILQALLRFRDGSREALAEFFGRLAALVAERLEQVFGTGQEGF